jgi:UDP-GlcNAc:undecaprenyl-phosphate GlcNAc-1-phosphate transferase
VNLDPYVVTLVAAFGAASATAAASLALARRLAGRSWLGGLLGEGARPPLGGFALLIGFAVAPFVADALSDRAHEYFSPKRGEFAGFLGATALVFLIGLIDDWRAVRPWQKLAGQLVAAGAVYAAGYQLESLAFPWGGSIDLGVMALPATLLWLLFFTNALNLVDGKDGLATGVGIFAAASLAAVAGNTEHPAVALLFVGLAGAGLGFLPFNLPPASLILGDSGALSFGFILSALAIRSATGVEESVFLAVPLLAMGFPVLDTLLAVTRRLLDRRSPLSRDRDHIHHRIEALGLGSRASLALLYLLSAAFAAAALTTHYVDSLVAEAAIFFGLVALIGFVLGRLGYVVTLWNSQRVLALRGRRVAR